jgi:phytoene dehydrogenase-like protein
MYDVIIVGAGWSGAAAARALSRGGHRILILEARDRIGGRAHTFNASGMHGPIDLGSSWIHGERVLRCPTKLSTYFRLILDT